MIEVWLRVTEGSRASSCRPSSRSARRHTDSAVHLAADGVDLLKTYTNVSVAAYGALAAEASKRGLLFAGHVPVRVPLGTVLAAGQHSVEHPRIFLLECCRGAAELRALPDPMAACTTAMHARFIDEHDPAHCAQAMASMAASNTWWTPTLQVLRMSALAGNRAFREDPRGRYIPFMFWSGPWQWDADGAVPDARNASVRDVDGELYRLAMDNVRQAHDAGVRIVAGTDAGDTYVFPGFAIHDELAELVLAGLSPSDALRSATIDAARFTGRDAEYGYIDVGKVADMGLLDGNPLTDIHDNRKIAGLFFNGEYLDRAALHELLAFAEDQAGSLRTNLQLVWGALRSRIVWAPAADEKRGWSARLKRPLGSGGIGTRSPQARHVAMSRPHGMLDRAPIVLAPGTGRAYPMGRISAVFKADGAESGDRYAISEWRLEPRTKGPGAHSHDEDDVFFVLEGTMSFLLGDRWIDGSPGTFVLVPGGMTHDFENRSEAPAMVLNFSAPGGFEPSMPAISEWFRDHPPQDTDA